MSNPAGYNAPIVKKQDGTMEVHSTLDVKTATGGVLKIDGVDVSAGLEEIANLTGLDSGELGVLNGVTPGTVIASKVVTVDSSLNTTGINNLTTTGNATLGNAAGDTFKVHGTAGSGAQSVFVADTSVTGAAATLTSAQIAGGESPTEGEHNAVQTDVAALKADIDDLYTTVAAQNALIVAMKACLVNHGLMAAS